MRKNREPAIMCCHRDGLYRANGSHRIEDYSYAGERHAELAYRNGREFVQDLYADRALFREQLFDSVCLERVV